MDAEMAGGLILGMFDYTYHADEDEVCLDENKDKDLFHPDGVVVAYVLSNFCNEYHPNYANLSKKAIDLNKQKFKEYNNNRGRKKKEKKKKNKKKNNGSNNEFGSCITFGLIVDERVHGIKMFRKNSGNISKLTHRDIQPTNPYIPNILSILFEYINTCKPVNIRYKSHYIALENITTKYNMPVLKINGYPINSDVIINLYKFRTLLDLGCYNPEFWGCRNVIYIFNGKVNHLKIMISEDDGDRITSLKLAPDGKIHAYGGSKGESAWVYVCILFKIIKNHESEICIRGIRASVKPKPRPDFTQELDMSG